MATPSWRIANGWREIFARIFDGFETRLNVTPVWLVNPGTNRRLKLDIMYPEANLAVRLEGQQASGQRSRRLSLEEEAQQLARFEARVEVCWQHGIHLVVVDLLEGKPSRVFQQIDTGLSRAAAATPDAALQKRIKQARQTAASLSSKFATNEDLRFYAELWSDREYRLAEPERLTPPPQAPEVVFVEGMAVQHPSFGPGVVLSTSTSNGELFITVDFFEVGEKKLMASLIAGKLLPR
jgi:hypothetical protein